MQAEQNHEITVYRGCRFHEPRKNTFFSTDPDFAADYGEVRSYSLQMTDVLDTTDRTTMEPYLPFIDPYDGSEVSTWEQYLERIGDTWEMIEAALPLLPQASIVLITEGGVTNYLVRDTSLVSLMQLPTPVIP